MQWNVLVRQFGCNKITHDKTSLRPILYGCRISSPVNYQVCKLFVMHKWQEKPFNVKKINWYLHTYWLCGGVTRNSVCRKVCQGRFEWRVKPVRRLKRWIHKAETRFVKNNMLIRSISESQQVFVLTVCIQKPSLCSGLHTANFPGLSDDF